MISVQAYQAPPYSEREALRYMGCSGTVTDEVSALLRDVKKEAENAFTYRVCWREFDVTVDGKTVDLTFAKVQSKALCKNLDGCSRVILFAATVGLGIDRLIAKYSRISPSRAVCLQALGAERIEALCDRFNEDRKAQYAAEGVRLRPRFSPGYGDLPLSLQKDIFAALDCPRKIGLTLGESLLMSPTKSVTAIIGISKNDHKDAKQ